MPGVADAEARGGFVEKRPRRRQEVGDGNGRGAALGRIAM